MLQGEHSAILSTFIKLPLSIKTFVLYIFEWPLKTGSTVSVTKVTTYNSTFIKLPFSLKTFVLFIFKCPLKTGFAYISKVARSLLTQTSDYVVLPIVGPVRVTVLFSNYIGFSYPIKLTIFRMFFFLAYYFLSVFTLLCCIVVVFIVYMYIVFMCLCACVLYVRAFLCAYVFCCCSCFCYLFYIPYGDYVAPDLSV